MQASFPGFFLLIFGKGTPIKGRHTDLQNNCPSPSPVPSLVSAQLEICVIEEKVISSQPGPLQVLLMFLLF